MSGHGGTYQYITSRPKQETAFVEGSYDADFKDWLKSNCRAKWDSDNKRWIIPKDYVGVVKREAKLRFGKVFYGEGGDYEEI